VSHGNDFIAGADTGCAQDDLQRRRLNPVFLLLAADSFGGPPGSREISQRLIDQRVPVCMIYCDADLSQTLSTFSPNDSSQDSTKWQ
jgi:hypothetical protein